MIVADANLVVYLIWPDPRSAEADAVWTTDPAWHVPQLWLSELRSAFGGHVRRGLCTIGEAMAALERAEAVIDGNESPVSSRVVLELSERSGCSTYDCEYVALAAALGVRLVTADREVLRAFPEIAIAPKEFARPG